MTVFVEPVVARIADADLPLHRQLGLTDVELDAIRESGNSTLRIGTTRRGIGPTYADKMQRATAIRVADLLHEQKLKERIGRVVEERNKVLKVLYDAPPLEAAPIFEEYRDFGRRIQPFVDDVGYLLLQYAKAGKRIVVSAHGNSIRALVKYLDGISDSDIVGLNIPNGIPLVYELDANLKPIKSYYLGDAEAAAQAAAAVANQGKA